MTEATTPPEMYGHTSATADVTTPEQNYKTLDITLLIEHDFIIDLEDGIIENAAKAYREFTKFVAQLYHGQHSPSEIRTALILAEDHLIVILDDEEIECAMSFKYAEKALKFIQKFLNFHGEPVEMDAEMPDETTVNSEKAPVTVFKWKLKFTDLVELIDALIEKEAVDIPPRAKKDFLNAIFRLFGVNKTPGDFNKARHKLCEKILDTPDSAMKKKNPVLKRSTFLPSLHEVVEEAWEKRYLGDYK